VDEVPEPNPISTHTSSRECAGKANLGKAPVLQPLVLAQCSGIRPFGGVPLKALPQEVIEEGRNSFWNGRFCVFRDAEHDYSYDISASTQRQRPIKV